MNLMYRRDHFLASTSNDRHRIVSFGNLVTIGRGIQTLFLLLLLCACTPTVGQSLSDSSPVNDPFQTGESKTRIKNLSADELIRAGYAYLESGSSHLAELHFTVAIEKDPLAAPAYAGLGEILRRRGESRQALEKFEKALENDPQHLPALLGMARVHREQDAPDKAIEYLNKALAVKADDPETLTEMAMTYDSMGQETLAEPLYAKVAELRPDSASSHNNLGFNYLLQGRYAEAISAFSRALSLDPQNKKAENNLAAAYALSGNEEMALQIFGKTVGKAGAYNNVGYIYMTQGEWDKAERAFRQALDLNPVFYERAQENLERLGRMRAQGSR